jgi:hypothetical protein
MNLQELSKHAVALYKANTALDLIGPPGVGKSSWTGGELIQILSAHYDEEFGFKSLLMPTIDAPDIRGFLVPTKDKDGSPASFWTRSGAMPSKDYLAAHPRGVMLLDEFNQSDQLVQKAASNTVLHKTFGDEKLPDGWWVLLASNRMADGAGTSKPLKHNVNRTRRINVDPDVNAWAPWAEENGVHPMFVAFAKKRPDVVFSPAVPKEDHPFCTPRSFVEASKLATEIAGLDAQGNVNMVIPNTGITVSLIAGDIGDGAAAELFAFLKVADQLPSIEDIIKDPGGANCPKDLSAAYAASQMIAHFAKADTIDPLWQYAERLPKELQVATAKALVPRGGGLLLNSKAMGAWMMKNKTLINASASK